MRICSYLLSEGTRSYGAVDDRGIRDVGADFRRLYGDLREVLAANALSDLEEAANSSQPLRLENVTLLPPIPNPDKIICIGLNYKGHIQETGRAATEKPSIFTRYPGSLVGHGQAMVKPKASDWFDFEGELAVVIGKPGRAIGRETAMEHVAGYSCFNDGSVRDFQLHTTQFWAGKNFDASGSMGPWLTITDEFPDPALAAMETRLNGQVMQATSVSDLAFDIPYLIEYLSSVTTLLPGDVIATGPPGGVGLFREPPLFMKASDLIEIEISGIGVLRNPIEAEV